MTDSPIIFLSSTCYDLRDLRAVMRKELEDRGFIVLMSDVSDGNFEIEPTMNSIEICLRNVEKAHMLILIFDKRYGPSIPKRDGKSATHLEFDQARLIGIPIVTFVRQDFLSDHRLWQKMKKKRRSSVDICQFLSYVSQEKKNKIYEFEKLFSFFEEMRTATSSKKSNWYETFTDVLELVRLAKKRSHEMIFHRAREIRRLLDAVLRSPSDMPIICSRNLFDSAMQYLSDLNLPPDHLEQLIIMGTSLDVSLESLLEHMDEECRNRALLKNAKTFLNHPKYSSYLSRWISSDILDRWKVYHDFEPNLDFMKGLIKSLSEKPNKNMSKIRNVLHPVLNKNYCVSYADITQNKQHELKKCKLVALDIIGTYGGKVDIPFILISLGDRGVPVSGLDQEHISYTDVVAVDDWEDQDTVMLRAIDCLRLLHRKCAPWIPDLLLDTIDRADCRISLRVNALRALLRLFGGIALPGLTEKVKRVIEDYPSRSLLRKLFEDFYKYDQSLEMVLLELSTSVETTRSICLEGLALHATQRSLPYLKEFFRSFPASYLPDIAYVIRYLINENNRNAISNVIEQRLLRELEDPSKMMSFYSVKEIIEYVGLTELLQSILQAVSDREPMMRQEILGNFSSIEKALNKVDEERKKGRLSRRFSSIWIQGMSLETYETENMLRELELQWSIKWCLLRTAT